MVQHVNVFNENHVKIPYSYRAWSNESDSLPNPKEHGQERQNTEHSTKGMVTLTQRLYPVLQSTHESP